MKIFPKRISTTSLDDMDRYEQRKMALLFLGWERDPDLLVWHHPVDEAPYYAGISDEALREYPAKNFLYLLGVQLQTLVINQAAWEMPRPIFSLDSLGPGQ